MNFKIVQFKPSKQKAVKDFIVNSWQEFGFKYIQKYDYDLDDPQEYYLKKGGMFYVLTDGKTIIGTIGIINKDGSVAEFKRLYVDQLHRGLGYGSQLVGKALSFCESQGFKKIEFETNKIFKTAHLLYLRKGFAIIKETKDSLYMEKHL